MILNVCMCDLKCVVGVLAGRVQFAERVESHSAQEKCCRRRFVIMFSQPLCQIVYSINVSLSVVFVAIIHS